MKEEYNIEFLILISSERTKNGYSSLGGLQSPLHPCCRKENDCQSSILRQFDVVQSLVHQPVVELPEPATFL